MSQTDSPTPTLWDRARRGAVITAALTVAGCQLWISPPRAPKQLRVSQVRQDPEKITIVLEYPHSYEGEDSSQTARVTVLRDGPRIDWQFTDKWLFDLEHKGSGAIGLALMSLPITLPLSPVLLSVNAWYAREERRVGMSRHAIALVDRISNQIQPQVLAVLVEALQDDWARRQRARAKVSYQEAIDVLSPCRLVWYEKDGFISAHWYDDDEGRAVAVYDTRAENAILVLGSRFTGEQRDVLITCFDPSKSADRYSESDDED